MSQSHRDSSESESSQCDGSSSPEVQSGRIDWGAFAPPKTRTAITPGQLAALTSLWNQTRFPTTAKREQVAAQVSLTPRKVQVWFQNQRQKHRRIEQQSAGPSHVPAPRGSDPLAPQLAPPQTAPNYTLSSAGRHPVPQGYHSLEAQPPLPPHPYHQGSAGPSFSFYEWRPYTPPYGPPAVHYPVPPSAAPYIVADPRTSVHATQEEARYDPYSHHHSVVHPAAVPGSAPFATGRARLPERASTGPAADGDWRRQQRPSEVDWIQRDPQSRHDALPATAIRGLPTGGPPFFLDFGSHRSLSHPSHHQPFASVMPPTPLSAQYPPSASAALGNQVPLPFFSDLLAATSLSPHSAAAAAAPPVSPPATANQSPSIQHTRSTPTLHLSTWAGFAPPTRPPSQCSSVSSDAYSTRSLSIESSSGPIRAVRSSVGQQQPASVTLAFGAPSPPLPAVHPYRHRSTPLSSPPRGSPHSFRSVFLVSRTKSSSRVQTAHHPALAVGHPYRIPSPVGSRPSSSRSVNSFGSSGSGRLWSASVEDQRMDVENLVPFSTTAADSSSSATSARSDPLFSPFA